MLVHVFDFVVLFGKTLLKELLTFAHLLLVHHLQVLDAVQEVLCFLLAVVVVYDLGRRAIHNWGRLIDEATTTGPETGRTGRWKTGGVALWSTFHDCRLATLYGGRWAIAGVDGDAVGVGDCSLHGKDVLLDNGLLVGVHELLLLLLLGLETACVFRVSESLLFVYFLIALV